MPAALHGLSHVIWFETLTYAVCVCVCVRACVRAQSLFETLWIVNHQAPLSVKFSSQEYWRELLFLTPGDLPDSGLEPTSLAYPSLAGGFSTTAPPGSPLTWGQFSPDQSLSRVRLFATP